jgi:hypothetical protein
LKSDANRHGAGLLQQAQRVCQAPEKLFHVATSPEHVCTIHENNKILTTIIEATRQNIIAADWGKKLLLRKGKNDDEASHLGAPRTNLSSEDS